MPARNGSALRGHEAVRWAHYERCAVQCSGRVRCGASGRAWKWDSTRVVTLAVRWFGADFLCAARRTLNLSLYTLIGRHIIICDVCDVSRERYNLLKYTIPTSYSRLRMRLPIYFSINLIKCALPRFLNKHICHPTISKKNKTCPIYTHATRPIAAIHLPLGRPLETAGNWNS